MKLSISEARKRLPELVRRVRKGNGAKVEITVHDEVVAELRGTMPAPQPGAAASKLLLLMHKLPKHRGRRTNVSDRVKQYLYGTAGTKR
jgi:antitoxin (DNA-binding transcriptional repressor) of toxin-antitoxin stability system